MRDSELRRAVQLREDGKAEEARVALVALAARWPEDAEVAYQAAWVHDTLGLEAEAVQYYRQALVGHGLSDRLGAYLGLGSTLRVLGRFSESVATFRRGLKEFPGDPGLRTFLAMALYNTGQPREAVSTLLGLLAETSADEHIQRYRRAIEYYAANLDETA